MNEITSDTPIFSITKNTKLKGVLKKALELITSKSHVLIQSSGSNSCNRTVAFVETLKQEFKLKNNEQLNQQTRFKSFESGQQYIIQVLLATYELPNEQKEQLNLATSDILRPEECFKGHRPAAKRSSRSDLILFDRGKRNRKQKSNLK